MKANWKTGTLACLATCAVLASQAAQATYVTASGTITHLYAHATFGNGDVALILSSSPGTCAGFWLRSSDPGFKTIYAQLLAARTTQTAVYIWAYDDQLWSGSGSAYCRIDAIDLVN